LNVHRINSLFYDKRLFDEHGLAPPRTIEELNELVVEIASNEEIQASSSLGVAPLALGNRWDWTLSLMAFEAILPAIGGPDYYERFWSGRADPSDPEFIETLDEVLFLYCGPDPETECAGYFNSDVDDVTWSEGVQKLVAGEAAMAVMGDWAKGYLQDQRLVADEDFGMVPFPGSSGTYVFTADSFPLPTGAQGRATRELLSTIGSVDGQVAFNSLKGSIPARTDVDPSDHGDAFDPMDERTMREFRDGRRVLALSGLVASALRTEMGAKLKESMHMRSTEILREVVEENYDSLE
jgi:glucose/mannose transport system substrate-binding protein